MPKPSVVEVKTGIYALMETPTWASKFKAIEGAPALENLRASLNTWLENNECDQLQNTDEDRKFLAQVIKQFFGNNAKFSFGKPKKIGGMDLATKIPALVIPTPAPPVYSDLTASWAANKTEFTKVRSDVARVLGIIDKGHAHHGSNFSGTQTLEDIIKNLYQMVKKTSVEEMTRVKGLILEKYKLAI